MALQIWLPLNGNINNQGLLDTSITGSPNSWDNGKIGKCAVFSGNHMEIDLKMIHSEMSICFWVKPNNPDIWCDILAFGTGNNRMENTKTSVESSLYRWYGESALLIANNSELFYLNNAVWSHVCMTIDGTNVKTYVNGVLTKTIPQTNTLNTVFGSTSKIYIASRTDLGRLYNGSINDFRIYDNCLSPREVKEIAKGMVCHYPLNDIYPTASINKYSGDTAEGKPTSSNFTFSKLADERGYNYKISYTGNGVNTWFCIRFPTYSFTVGKTYDYSCKIKAKSCNFNIWLRGARCDNDYGANKTSIIIDNKWHEYHVRQVISASFDLQGNTINSSPKLEFYTDNLSTKDKVYSIDFDIKDVQVSECDVDAEFSDAMFKDTTVYDTSGLKNNGTMSPSLPTYSNGAPRYGGCYKLNGKDQFIIVPKTAKITDAITVSIWAYMDKWTDVIRFISCTEGGGWNIENSHDLGDKMSFIVYANGAYRYATSTKTALVLSAGWHHFAGTYNGLKVCFYIDGKLEASSTPFTTKTPITYNDNNTIFIGGEAVGDTTAPGGVYFNGKVSDFRLYATALSETDIKELYEAPITVTNTGVLMTQGEFKEV